MLLASTVRYNKNFEKQTLLLLIRKHNCYEQNQFITIAEFVKYLFKKLNQL